MIKGTKNCIYVGRIVCVAIIGVRKLAWNFARRHDFFQRRDYSNIKRRFAPLAVCQGRHRHAELRKTYRAVISSHGPREYLDVCKLV